MINEIRGVLSEDRVLVAYRWAPDQFLAAVMLADYVVSRGREAGFHAFTSHRVDMGLVSRLASESRKYDSLVLLGPGWRGPEIDLVASNVLAPIVVIDNAYNRIPPRRPNVLYFNPSPRGDPRGVWPSVTFLLGTILGDATNLLVASSIVALLGRKSIAVRAYQNSMTANGLSHVEDYFLVEECALRAAGLTASGDAGSMAGAALSIAEASLGDLCRAILDDALLATHAGVLEAWLEEYTPARLVDGVADGDTLRMIVSRNSAFSLGALAAAGGGDSWCLWEPGRSSIIPLAREALRQGLAGYAVHQGLVNYACISGRGSGEWVRRVIERPK